MPVHCPECGFVNAEGANYCQKCGAYLSRPEGTDEPTTMTYRVDDTGRDAPGRHRRGGGFGRGRDGDPRRRRQGGGELPDRGGPRLDRPQPRRRRSSSTTSPCRATTRCVVKRRDGLYIDDLGSLNGTYVNRRRIESHPLADGDEIQVGKYKLSYLEK